MEELIEILNKMLDSYYDFVNGISNYCKKKPSRLGVVKEFIERTPNATSSDVVKFVMSQPYFFEDDIRKQSVQVG